MKKAKPNNNHGNLPNAIIHQVNEHTIGGFIIFYFNQDTGKPEQMMNFDSPAHALALQKHIADWTEAVHQVNLENSVTNIQNHLDSLNEQEPPDDDEEEKQ